MSFSFYFSSRFIINIHFITTCPIYGRQVVNCFRSDQLEIPIWRTCIFVSGKQRRYENVQIDLIPIPDIDSDRPPWAVLNLRPVPRVPSARNISPDPVWLLTLNSRIPRLGKRSKYGRKTRKRANGLSVETVRDISKRETSLKNDGF